MDEEFWKERWQADQIGFHQGQINPYLVAYWSRLDAAPDSRVFVPLSGKSLDLRWLQSQGHRVMGVEVSPIAVADFFKEAGVEPERHQDGEFQRCSHGNIDLWCGNFFNLSHQQLADVGAVFDRASLIAMPPAMRPDYARHLAAILPSSTPILLVTMEYPDGQMQGPPFSVSDTEVGQLFDEHYHIDKLHEEDILAQSPRFQAKGLTTLVEKAFALRPVG
jgi:thiopurine S-methyltransferase